MKIPKLNSIDELNQSTPHLNFLAIADVLSTETQTPLYTRELVWAVRAVICYDHRFALVPDLSIHHASRELIDQLSELNVIQGVDEGAVVIRNTPDEPEYLSLRAYAKEVLQILNIV